MWIELFPIMAPVFICAGIGFTWTKLGRSYDSDLITVLITNIGAPCLIFSTLTQIKLNPLAFTFMVAATLAASASRFPASRASQ